MENKNLTILETYKHNVFMCAPFLDNIIIKAEGVYIEDANGKRMLDFAAGTFCSILGHSHPKLVARLRSQLGAAIHVGAAYLSLPFLEAAGSVAKILPGDLNKVIFFSTGTEANEAAVKIAKEYTGRCGLLGFDKGHLGSSYLIAQASLFNPSRPSCKPRIPYMYKFMTPTCHHCPVRAKYPECDFLCIAASEKRLGSRLKRIAAMLAEPVISEAGVTVPPPGYFKRLKAMLAKHGILLIIDEAQTAFGRTGRWFAIEHNDVTPDILVASKTCGSGYPVSMVAARDFIQEKLIKQGFAHITSHMNDPLGAEAVSAVIHIISEEGLLENSNVKGRRLFDLLSGVKKDFPQIIREVRGLGLMIGVELNGYKDETQEQTGLRLAYTLIENGLNINWFSPSVHIYEPPITVTDKDIDEAIKILRLSIEEVLADRTKNSGICIKNEIKEPFWKKIIKKSYKK